MAICGDCGAASAEGAARCAACGRSFAIGEVEFGDGGISEPQEKGSWGSGVAVEPRQRPAAVRWFTDADWRPALRAVAAPTGLLLVAALLLALGMSDGRGTVGFGTRFGVALAVALAAFGGPVGTRSWFEEEGFSPELANQLWVLPMTVTLLWAVLFGYGLRVARRRLAPELTGRRLLAEAGRPVLLAVAVTAVLGLLAGAEHGGDRLSSEPIGLLGWPLQFGLAEHAVVSPGAAWSVLGSAVLAGALVAWVYGADRLRGVVADWAVSAAAAGRVLLLTVVLAALVALVVTASLAPLEATLLGLMVLPNLGLYLLGLGAGATVGRWEERGGRNEIDLRADLDDEISLFDLAGQSGHLRWTVLLALAAALLLGWTVRRLNLAGRIRAAAVCWTGAGLLMLLSGSVQRSSFQLRGEIGQEIRTGEMASAAVTVETTWGLALFSALAANLVWTALGAFVVPRLFRREPLPLLPPEPPSAIPPQPTYVPFTGEVLDSRGPDNR